MKKLIFITTLVFSFSLFATSTFIPPIKQPVTDEANLLSKETVAKLNSTIRGIYAEGKGPQLAVYVVNSLNGNVIEDYAHKVFTTWKLGNEKRDDGVLFLVSLKDRKMRIEVGQGLEGVLTDYTSKKIINSVTPYFKSKDLDGGITVAVNSILKVISQPEAAPAEDVFVKSISKKETPPRKLTAAEQQALGGVFYVVILLASFIFPVRAYSRWHREREELKELEQKALRISEDNKGESLPQVNLKRQGELKNLAAKRETLREVKRDEYAKNEFAPLRKKENLERELTNLENDISNLEYQNQSYKLMIKEGK